MPKFNYFTILGVCVVAFWGSPLVMTVAVIQLMLVDAVCDAIRGNK